MTFDFFAAAWKKKKNQTHNPIPDEARLCNLKNFIYTLKGPYQSRDPKVYELRRQNAQRIKKSSETMTFLLLLLTNPLKIITCGDVLKLSLSTISIVNRA